VSVLQLHAAVCDGDRNLGFDRLIATPQLVHEARPIDRFQEPGAEFPVYLDRRSNHASAECRVAIHRRWPEDRRTLRSVPLFLTLSASARSPRPRGSSGRSDESPNDQTNSSLAIRCTSFPSTLPLCSASTAFITWPRSFLVETPSFWIVAWTTSRARASL